MPAQPDGDTASPKATDADGKDRLGSDSSEGAQEPNDEKNASKPSTKRPKWSIGILADKETDEVPGSILLLSKVSEHNAPLGLQNMPARNSSSSIPSLVSASSVSRAMFRRRAPAQDKKTTEDGKIILEPQPDESKNDPLNWSVLRRDVALLSLGFYCMVGGGMTTVLAPGFTNVAETYNVSIPQVALTTGLYMAGLGVGSVIASPTAIAFGKRPVYLAASILYLLTSVWCALSPNYSSLVVARVVQGLAVSPVECLPSATIAEIFFLHERAYRLGIYTLLLLGGKNLVPLVSAAIIQSLGWRWVFWVVAMIVGFCFGLLFLFVPETFWDRSPRPAKPHRRPSFAGLRRMTSPKIETTGRGATGSETEPKSPQGQHSALTKETSGDQEKQSIAAVESPSGVMASGIARRRQQRHAHFAAADEQERMPSALIIDPADMPFDGTNPARRSAEERFGDHPLPPQSEPGSPGFHSDAWRVVPLGGAPPTPLLHTIDSPYYSTQGDDYFSQTRSNEATDQTTSAAQVITSPQISAFEAPITDTSKMQYTHYYQEREPKTFLETLKPYSGRLSRDNWFRVALRPFILYAYPAILWSAAVYALSVGWLIVLSESVSTIYRDADTYNFSAIATGLVYISPFVGGVLGTAVAGKVSDLIVRFISRRNDGVYEPEFRLVMAIPVAITTAIGLMGYGWSAEERDNFWVPTIFFGIVSFGCTLGSTTAITFAVDSYRQYAGEALVTLNFSKNIFHGLVFSLFFNNWLDSDGSKEVFVALGGIQLFFLLFTIPMYIFGKRARMWTVRRNLMEKF